MESLEKLKKDYNDAKSEYAHKCKVYDEVKAMYEEDPTKITSIYLITSINDMQNAHDNMEAAKYAYEIAQKLNNVSD